MLIPFIVAVILLAADLVSKQVVCHYTALGERITVLRGILSFTYSENRGASFGLFGDHPILLLVMTTVFTIGLIVFCVIKRRDMHKLAQFSLWMIISGAIGNLYDRFTFGYVRDFIDYEFISAIIGRDFAICNFADLVLIVGTVMLLVYVLFIYSGDKAKPEKAAAAEATNGPEKADPPPVRQGETVETSAVKQGENDETTPAKQAENDDSANGDNA